MTTALFVHHSIGRQIIEGGLRERLRLAGTDLWDHDYNEIGLTGPDGVPTGRSFPVPHDDTDPSGLVVLLRALTEGSLPDVPSHDLLILKSCFPNSAVTDEGLPALQDTYLELRDLARALPQTVLLLSSPPLSAESTSRREAANAARVAAWLAETWPGEGLAFGDLFSALSHQRGPLRGTLRLDARARRPRDSHLSAAGARRGAALVADAVASSVQAQPA